MWNSLKIIKHGIQMKKGSTSWRINADYYLRESECQIRPGTVSVAPAWFQQAHKVRQFNFFCSSLLSDILGGT